MKNKNNNFDKQSISYAFLGFSRSLLSQTVAVHLMFFYTDVLSIPLKAITVLFLVSHIWDAVNDEVFGYLMVNTKSKHGISRPYILWTALPMGILTIGMFYSPNVSVNLKIIYAYIIYFIWDSVYTLLSISANSLLPLMSKSKEERTKNNSYTIIASVIAALIASSFLLPLANFFGGGNLSLSIKGNYQVGFPLTMLLFSLVAVPMQIFAFKNVKEKYYVKEKEPMSLKIYLKCFSEDKTLIIFFFTFMLTSIANTFKNSSATYYVISVLKRPEAVSIIAFSGIGASILMQLLINKIIKRISIVNITIIGMGGSIIGLFIMLLSPTNLFLTILGNMVFGLASAIPANLVYVILAEYIDKFNERFKTNLNSLLYATLNFGTKVGIALGGAIISQVLYMTGYDSKKEASPLVIKGITFNFLGGTIIGYVISFILMIFLTRLITKHKSESELSITGE